jgi:acyl-CoA synthetase (NDP forming)
MPAAGCHRRRRARSCGLVAVLSAETPPGREFPPPAASVHNPVDMLAAAAAEYANG